MAELYIVDFGGSEQEQARREAEHRRLADRYARHLVASAEVDEAAARRVITVLFHHRDADIVRTIRDHLHGAGCEHHGVRLFCPDCGQRMGTGS